MENKKSVWDLLEEAPIRVIKTAELYSWSLNYDWKSGTPYLEFLDLIGYSVNEFGEKLNDKRFEIDSISVESFSGALLEWANNPEAVTCFIDELREAEGE